MCPYWVDYSGVTSAYFGLTTCSGLWLLASVQVDCINLIAVLILDMSPPSKDDPRYIGLIYIGDIY